MTSQPHGAGLKNNDMKARIEKNGNITIYQVLPMVWKKWGNFRKADKDLQNSQGFYDYIPPTPESNQKLGPIYFDESNEIFTNPLLPKTVADYEASFVPQLAKDALFMLFIDKLIVTAGYYSILSDLIDDKGFIGIYKYLGELLADSVISQEEYNSVLAIFMSQNIDLTNYQL